MRVIEYPAKETWKTLTRRPQLELGHLEGTVRNILNRVRSSGDAALIEFTEQLDKVKINDVEVPENKWREDEQLLSNELKEAIGLAATNIEKFHAAQRKNNEKIETMPGVTCWRKDVAIEKVGVYIPGGSAPLFSTVLMLGVPARLAGCKEVILCSPPGPAGKINAAISYAARLVGVTKIFRIGGAQAIAAMAYGTQSVPAVDKIFGPGNQYVTKAKQLVNQTGTAIDLPAGPSEVVIIADAQADPAFVAADLLAQAEHGPDSQVAIVTSDKLIVPRILQALEKQTDVLPRRDIAQQVLENSFAVILLSDEETIEFVNEYAPEHLIINTVNCDALAEQILNSGSIFLGPYSPESAGDYASGTNHTLPTNGFAKAYSGVSLESFTKTITYQKLTAQGIKNLGPVVEVMAEAEQLEAHKKSITIRLKALQ